MIGPSIPKEILDKRRKHNDNKKNTTSDSSDESDDDIVGPSIPDATYSKSINLEQSSDEKEVKRAQNDDSRTKNAKASHEEPKNVLQSPIREKQTLLSKHRAKNTSKNKVTKYDSTESLNNEIRKEILRKLDQNGGLEGKFTRGS